MCVVADRFGPRTPPRGRGVALLRVGLPAQVRSEGKHTRGTLLFSCHGRATTGRGPQKRTEITRNKIEGSSDEPLPMLLPSRERWARG